MTTTKTSAPFFSAGWNFPGCLPDTSDPLPVFGSFKAAAEYLAGELDTFATDDNGETDDAFADLSTKLREAAEDDPDGPGWLDIGPDGLSYWVEKCEPRGVFVADESDLEDIKGRGGVLLTYTPSSATDVPTTEARDDLQSIAGSNIEAPADMDCAYVSVDLDRLDEAAAELRESGYGLDLSYFPTLRDRLDFADLDTFRLSDFHAFDAGPYEVLGDDERRAKLLALACDPPASVAYSALERPSTEDQTDVATHGVIGGSDYSNGAVGRSNAATFRELVDEADARLRLDVCGSHGSDSVLVFLDIRTTDEAAGAITEALSGLSDYPLLSEDDLSHREQEEADENWTSYGGDDFARALEKEHDLSDVERDDDALRELFDARAEVGNVNGGPGVEHNSEGPYFYTKEVAEETPAVLVAFAELISDGFSEGLRMAVDGERDDARRLYRIVRTGELLRNIVAPMFVRAMLAHQEKQHGPEKTIAKGSPAEQTRRQYAEAEAKRAIMSALVDEGDTCSEISADSWAVCAQRAVTVTLRRYTYGPGMGMKARTAAFTIDPGASYSAQVTGDVSGLFPEPDGAE